MLNRRAEIATLIAILVGASVIRFWGITWGLPHAYHPDEGSILFHALGFGTGDLNPHWFRWPSLTMYVMFGIYGGYYVIGKLMGTFSVPPDLVKAYLTDLSPFWLMGRIVSAASGVVTVWITWLFGRKSFGSYVGLTAAAILAVLLLHVRDSHYATPDVMAAMLAAGSLLAALYACRSSRSSFILLSGFLAGLSMSAKYPGVLAAIGTLVALVVLVRRRRGGFWLLPASGVVIVAGFLIGTPYALLSSDEFTRDVVRQFTMVSEAGIAQEASSYAAGLREIVMESLGRGVGWAVMLMAAVGALLPIGLWGAKLSYAHRRRQPAALTGEPTIADAAAAKTIAVSFSIAVLLVMSLLTVKRATYLTLALPSVAFLAAVGLEGLFARLAVRRHRALAAALVVIAAAAVPSVRYLSALAVVDTRTRAKEWVEQHVEPGTGIAVEDYGPVLNPTVGQLEAEMTAGSTAVESWRGPKRALNEMKLDVGRTREPRYKVYAIDWGREPFSLPGAASDPAGLAAAIDSLGVRYVVLSSKAAPWRAMAGAEEPATPAGQEFSQWLLHNASPVAVFGDETSMPMIDRGRGRAFHNPIIEIHEIKRPAAKTPVE